MVSPEAMHGLSSQALAFGILHPKNNLKRFGSPTLAASVSASASDYLDTFRGWGSWRQHGMHGQLALKVGPLWLIAQVLVLELELG